MSRKTRHALHAKKGTHAGSSSILNNNSEAFSSDKQKILPSDPSFHTESSSASNDHKKHSSTSSKNARKTLFRKSDCMQDDNEPVIAKLDFSLNRKRSRSEHTKPKRMVGILVAALAVLLIIASYGAFKLIETHFQAEYIRAESEANTFKELSDPSIDLVENPIDFDAEQAKAPDAYAWIYIPNTNISFPIMRHPENDNYYLDHTSEKEDSWIGAIYTQSMNSMDFSDPVTLVYGHNLPRYDVMFTELHNFEDASFFDSNENFYIYLPEHVLAYKVIAAYEYDNRHIMNSFDFSDESVLQDYFNYVLSPESEVANVRNGVSLDASSDKIVQLSTCTNPSDPSKRYIVTGVLISDQPTKRTSGTLIMGENLHG